jgi:hypothetical protein
MNAQLLQLLISVGGITLMVGLCWALFGRRSVPLANTSALSKSLAQDIPGFRTGRIALSRDAISALIEDARDGAVYLVVSRGDGLVTRKLAPDTLVARDGDRLDLRLRDFTLRQVQLDLADAAAWETKLKAVAV